MFKPTQKIVDQNRLRTQYSFNVLEPKIDAKLASKCKSVLVVDDNPDVARIIPDFISSDSISEFSITSTQTRSEALDLLSRNSYDLIILDYRMPGEMDILEFLTHVKHLSPGTPLILMSASLDAIGKDTLGKIKEWVSGCMSKESLVDLSSMVAELVAV